MLKAHFNLLLPFALVSVPVHIVALGPWWQNPAEIRVEEISNPLQLSLTRATSNIPAPIPDKAKAPAPKSMPRASVTSPAISTPVLRNNKHDKASVMAGLDDARISSGSNKITSPKAPSSSAKTEITTTQANNQIDEILPTERNRDDDTLKDQIRAQLNFQIRFHRVYPRLAIRNAWQGQVDLGIHVMANGTLSRIRILRSSGHSILDKAAMQSLQRVAVIPEAEDWLQGRDFDVILPVIYRLQDS